MFLTLIFNFFSGGILYIKSDYKWAGLYINQTGGNFYYTKAREGDV